MALLPVADAVQRILDGVRPLPAETVPLADARGRTLAKPLKARRNQPPFDASAMDGYAVRAEDVANVPATLKIIGEAPAGRAFNGKVRSGKAVRIFTGAPVPRGADTVIIQEDTERDGDMVRVLEGAPRGKFVRRAGLDFARGETLIEAGALLGPRLIGLAAAMTYPALPVRRRPKVAILGTGDELIAPGGKPRADQIISSNGYAIGAAVAQFGGEVADLGIAPDRLAAIAEAIASARDADILITIGGASVGDHDLVQDALLKQGYRLDFWKIAMRPGKPLMFARKGRQRLLGLPGNPVSSLVCSLLFLKPLVTALLGRPVADETLTMTLGADMRTNDQRQDYIRARIEQRDGQPVAVPFPVQDSSMQRTLARADVLIIRPPHAPAIAAGEPVSVLPIDI